MWPVTSSSMAAFSMETTASGPPRPSLSVNPSGIFEPWAPAATMSPSSAIEAEERRRPWLASFSVHTASEISPLCANKSAPVSVWRVQWLCPFIPHSPCIF